MTVQHLPGEEFLNFDFKSVLPADDLHVFWRHRCSPWMGDAMLRSLKMK
jgi:hypothetical protein